MKCVHYTILAKNIHYVIIAEPKLNYHPLRMSLYPFHIIQHLKAAEQQITVTIDIIEAKQRQYCALDI